MIGSTVHNASQDPPALEDIAFTGYALPATPPFGRPLAVTLIACVQFLKAAILLAVVAIPIAASENSLAYIPHLREFVFFASHGKDPRGVAPLLLGVYAIYTGVGLWKLRRWARNSLALGAATTLLLWFCHVEYQVGVFTMPTLAQVEVRTIHTLLLFDFVVLAYLKYNNDCECAFAAGS